MERYADGGDRRLASELGVQEVVEGTVRIENDRVRVAVQLIDAKTAQTLWADQYDRVMGEVLRLETEGKLRISANRSAGDFAMRRRSPPRTSPNANWLDGGPEAAG